jgi:hypothetical protein
MMDVPEGEFAGALAAWDQHIERCHTCFNEGMTLCAKGQSLTDEVMEIRAAEVIATTSDGPQRPFRGPQRTTGPAQAAA